METSRTDQREESLVFSFRPNSDVKSRQATVRLVDSEGNLLDSICFTQATSGSVNVRLERADVWTQVIWLSGSCASDVAQAGSVIGNKVIKSGWKLPERVRATVFLHT